MPRIFLRTVRTHRRGPQTLRVDNGMSWVVSELVLRRTVQALLLLMNTNGTELHCTEHEQHVPGYNGRAAFAVPACNGRAALAARQLGSVDEPDWDFQSWQPAAVIINLGTNDYHGVGANTTDSAFVKNFTDTYHALVNTITSSAM